MHRVPIAQVEGARGVELAGLVAGLDGGVQCRGEGGGEVELGDGAGGEVHGGGVEAEEVEGREGGVGARGAAEADDGEADEGGEGEEEGGEDAGEAGEFAHVFFSFWSG